MKTRPVLAVVMFVVAALSLAGAAFLIGGCSGQQMACPMMSGGMPGMSCHMPGQPAGGSTGAASASLASVANNRCPIMGGAIKPDSVPASLTREYKGQKVGFCCGGCPGSWDKLSDADKDAKLAKVVVAAK